MRHRHHDRDGNPVSEAEAPFEPGTVSDPDADMIPEEDEDLDEVDEDDVDEDEDE